MLIIKFPKSYNHGKKFKNTTFPIYAESLRSFDLIAKALIGEGSTIFSLDGSFREICRAFVVTNKEKFKSNIVSSSVLSG